MSVFLMIYLGAGGMASVNTEAEHRLIRSMKGRQSTFMKRSDVESSRRQLGMSLENKLLVVFLSSIFLSCAPFRGHSRPSFFRGFTARVSLETSIMRRSFHITFSHISYL